MPLFIYSRILNIESFRTTPCTMLGALICCLRRYSYDYDWYKAARAASNHRRRIGAGVAETETCTAGQKYMPFFGVFTNLEKKIVN